MKQFLKKCLLTLALSVCIPLCLTQGSQCKAQAFGNIPPLHVDGKWLKDPQGNKVVLHGVMDTPSPYFNNYRWGWNCDDNNTTNCINYFNKLFTAITDTANGAYCNVFRLHLDPCWTNDNNVHYCDKTGDGEANIEHFSKTKLQKYMKSLYWKIIEKALKHGLYVVVRPPGVCPERVKVGDVYNNYLMEVWDIVSQNDSILKYSGQVSIELANEPVTLLDANGNDTPNALHDFFQPIVNKIRANGFTGIIWAPGTGWQGNYRSYATNPITGYNIGYAVHDYVGWYNTSDNNYNTTNAINSFKASVPVVETAPIIITEVDWSPEKPGAGHYNEHGDWVTANYGTWATGSTSKWGRAYKAVLDNFENISMTLSGTACYIDIDKSIATTPAKPVIAFNGNEECCGKACFDWYKEYAIGKKAKIPYADYKRKWTADLGAKYKNPIINGDFPDPDVIRVGDTFYMVSTTMFYFPGATILKSKDLVNWEYCANPLKQIANNNAYNLEGANHYSQGQWAASLNYSGGKFYLYFICYGRDKVDNTMNILLTTTNPEGEWDMQYMDDHYYDSGWLFDDKDKGGDGYIYVACGIGDIYVNKLNRNLQKLSSTKVLSLGNGLEGCHMYHINDYYYIYATYGGTEGSQTIFRSKNPMGPYEEHEGRVFANQHIHQGALVDTPTGEWWTVLFKDAGAIGRIPYLEPVKWVDDWPVIGNNGIDVTKNGASYKKPTVADSNNISDKEDLQKKYLPTNDTFTNPKLGLQWEWNHNEVESGWSLFDNPGNLRLYTTSVTDSLIRARGSLTQRILGYNPEGTSSSRYYNSYGTIKMDISHMQEGDVAGISIFQDPYSQIGIKVIDGKRYLYSALVYAFDGGSNGKEILGDEITQDIIYLRAVANFGTNKAKYYYSLDNKTWTKFGVDMDMRFILTIFTGNRFFIYNYGTQRLGGYVDIDWFSTEPVYEESMFYNVKELVTYTPEDLTIESLSINKKNIVMNTSSSYALQIISKSVSGMETNVAANCIYDIENNDFINIIGGRIITKCEGSTNVTATYTDHFGNIKSVDFSVTASIFPLSSECFNPSIYGTGTFTESTTTLQTSQYGFGGWVYNNGIDLSDYNYIVVKTKRSTTCNPSFRIFDKNNYWSDPYIRTMGKFMKVAIDLHDMKSENGRTIDPSHIYMAGFWTEGNDKVYIKEVFLSNDGVNPANGIESVIYRDENDEDNGEDTESVTNIQGMRLSSPQKGINIIRMTDGTTKKILIK
ncbi:MAG: family 43 glycosylhydrolase [Bacteroidaceae bacterium]|nr:family 43 glycosylhydrolase [Bacteroidaceae bacterium]